MSTLMADLARTAGSDHSVNPVVFDRFVLMTEDREIAFLFRSGETTPFAVCKRGDPEALAAERRNHERALQLLGDSVPALLNDVGNGSLAQEATPEIFWEISWPGLGATGVRYLSGKPWRMWLCVSRSIVVSCRALRQRRSRLQAMK